MEIARPHADARFAFDQNQPAVRSLFRVFSSFFHCAADSADILAEAGDGVAGRRQERRRQHDRE
jgi:hypothetical protein